MIHPKCIRVNEQKQRKLKCIMNCHQAENRM